MKSIARQAMGAVALMIATGAVDQVAAQDFVKNSGSWTVVERVEYGTIYIDPSSITPIEDGLVNVRTRWEFAEAQTARSGAQYGESIALRAIDCAANEMAIVAYIELDQGVIVETAEIPPYAAHWFDVGDSHILEEIVERSCARKDVPRLAAET